MKLRLISGELKGRYVLVGDDVDYRPTQERVRESAAEIVKRKVRGAVAADVCAGSGAFGFEMLSRGAASVDFVEADKRKAAVILDNADRLGVRGRVKVIRDEVCRFIGIPGFYDIIFYDPPYDVTELAGLIPKLLTLLNDDGVLIYERRRRHKEKKSADVRVYADTAIEIYHEGKNADGVIPGDF